MTLMRDALSVGSSPLARGLRRIVLRCRGLLRIIPARAGFTVLLTSDGKALADHPRSRGVYPGPTNRFAYFGGSSPLARGLQTFGGREVAAPRIIPARAGFTV